MSEAFMTRRRFSAGLLAAGAMAVAPRSVRAQAAPKDRIRAAVFGCRNRGHQVALAFDASGRFDVTDVYDCDSACFETAAQKLKGRISKMPRFDKDFRRALDDKSVDAVVVATPDHWHALMAVMAIEAGKHVYLEKPASFNIDDGKAIVAAQKRHPKLVVQVGTQQRSGRHFRDAANFIRSGGIGKVGFARAWFTTQRGTVKVVPDADPPATLDYDLWCGPAPKRPYNPEKLHYNWHYMRDYGTGDAGNWGGHWLDTVRMLAGLDLPTAAMGLGGRYVTNDAKEWPDTATVLYEYPKLTVVWEMRYWSSYGVNGMGGGAEIRGEKGTVIIDRGGWKLFADDARNAAPREYGASPLEEPHVENFADCITGNARPAAGIVEGHKSAILCHLANIASTFNRRIEFDPRAESIINDAEAARMMGREYRRPWKMPTG